MKSKVIIADLHLHNWQAFAQVNPDTGLNSRLQALLKAIVQAGVTIKKSGGDTIYIAGDLFHVRGKLAPSVLNPAIDTLKKLIAAGIKVVVIPGNHDLEGKGSTHIGSAVKALEEIGCLVCAETQIFVEEETAVIPWFDKLDDLRAELHKLALNLGPNRDKYDVIIHAPLNGVITGLPDHGLSSDELAAFGFKRVFAGHHHHHKDCGGGVWSIGALAHHTWSDVNSASGYLLVNGETVYRFNTDTPKFIDLDLEAISDEQDFIDAVAGNYVRVKANMVGSEIATVREGLTKAGALGIVVQPIKKSSVERKESVTASIKAGASVEASVSEYVGSQFKANAEVVTREALRVLAQASVGEE